MKRYTHITNIGKIKVSNVSHGASVNYGPAIHKGYQANVKLVTDQLAIGDEFTFGCPNEQENGEDDSE
ncbi:spore gernimation protein [Cytobacillus sp. FJAT-54145]|uniref:Spore gernimation protein n=1 Tax=Cytobacillus spartinae TaxID=3299023 RepID=A0ABW6K7F1_9BACI